MPLQGASTVVGEANHPMGAPAPLMLRPVRPPSNSWRTSSGIPRKQSQK